MQGFGRAFYGFAFLLRASAWKSPVVLKSVRPVPVSVQVFEMLSMALVELSFMPSSVSLCIYFCLYQVFNFISLAFFVIYLWIYICVYLDVYSIQSHE